MDSNTHSNSPLGGLRALAVALDELAAHGPDGLPDAARAERVLVLRGLVDRLEGHWLQALAAVDAAGAAGADHGHPAPSTAGWLRHRLQMGPEPRPARSGPPGRCFVVRFRPPPGPDRRGAVPSSCWVLAHGTHDLPDHLSMEAEPVLLEAARRLDPPRLRRVLGHLRLVADPDHERDQVEVRHGRRGLWLAPT